MAAANPAARFRHLYSAATRIGRAHIASVINTLVLAYAGASLPLLLLLAAGNQPLGEVLTGQFMAEEIVRSIVGTLGLIAAVPLTTALAALAAVRGAVGTPSSAATVEVPPAPAHRASRAAASSSPPGRPRGGVGCRG